MVGFLLLRIEVGREGAEGLITHNYLYSTVMLLK